MLHILIKSLLLCITLNRLFYIKDGVSVITVNNTFMRLSKVYMFSILYFTEKKETPKFVKKMENIDTIEKQTVTFETEVVGKPKPHVTW